MIGYIEKIFLRIRRWLSRSEWLVRLLRLPVSKGTESKPGLILIQIDGLSRNQLEAALDRGRMPFLKRIIDREGYHLHTLYSGLPSNTPAFQGEFFYGVKFAVPAFSFRDRKTHEILRLYDPNAAAYVQEELEKKNAGLLKGGSAYSDVFSGGAEESHFCPATLGWSGMFQSAGPLTWVLLSVWYAWSFIRVLALLILEFMLAVVDGIRGIIAREDIWKELKFVPTRVAICILLREMITMGGELDCARGISVIHLNYLGYDEQAHRRGPSSSFAHWSLKGIDDAIMRIWHAARRSSRRDYQIWIYSDHGQEKTESYAVENNKSVQEAVIETLGQGIPVPGMENHYRIQLERAKWFGGLIARWLFGEAEEIEKIRESNYPIVTAMGPIGYVYPVGNIGPKDRARMARALVKDAKIPLVIIPDSIGHARAWTPKGEFRLPEQAKDVLGSDHPFLERVAQDLVALSFHPDAGDFMISGWRKEGLPISFPSENGGHAGPGPEETRAFALLPVYGPKPPRDQGFLCPQDLREGAIRVLEGSYSRPRHDHRGRFETGRSVTVMTYNVHSCVGMDGKLSPDRIARVIAQYDPDIVALQELDVGRRRTGEVDQAHVIANILKMDYHFYPALQLEEEQYGDAILSHFPMRLVRSGALPTLPNRPYLESRGAIWVEITLDHQKIQLINTHLGLSSRERRAQVEALLGAEWLGHSDCREPVILCGDFNARPGSKSFMKICDRLQDAQDALESHRPKGTFFSRYPFHRIDHVFLDQTMNVRSVQVPQAALTRIASDHLPLIVELEIP